MPLVRAAAAARHAALPVPAADRLQGHGRRVGQHRRARQPDELRAGARRQQAARTSSVASLPTADGSPRRRRCRRRRARRSPRRPMRRQMTALTLGAPEFQTTVDCIMHVATSLSEKRRVRVRQPRLRAVVPGAHGVRRRRPARAKQLIAIFQRGAVDGLSVVVPFGEADYYRARPSIAIPRPGDGENGGARSRRLLRLQPAAAAAQAALGSRASSRSSTRADRPTARGRTSTRRTTWKRRRPA